MGEFLGVNRFMKKRGLQNMGKSKPWKNVRSVMFLIVLKTKWFWKNSSLDDGDNRNDQRDSSDEDFRGFYDQLKIHAALPFC